MTDYATALTASGPDPEHAAGLALFGQFVGEWSAVVRSRTRGGPWTEATQTLIFSWVLGGRAVSSVALDAEGTPLNVTVRVWDATAAVWRVTRNSADGSITSLVGSAYGDGVRLEGLERTAAHPDGRAVRWNVDGITADTFVWEGWVADDEDGPNWENEHRADATRVR